MAIYPTQFLVYVIYRIIVHFVYSFYPSILARKKWFCWNIWKFDQACFMLTIHI